MNPHIFRQYDIRGVAESDLSDPVIDRIGRALSGYYRDRGIKEVVIGRDVRLSSPRISQVLTGAFLKSGLDVIDIGVVPTPLLYFSLHHYDHSAGVMITGSHNPKEFNGLKICCHKTTIYGDEIQEIRRRAEAGSFPGGSGTRHELDPVPDYIDQVLDRVEIESTPPLILDPGNGTVGPVIDRLLSRLNLRYQIINLKPDGNFPSHLPDPTVLEYIEPLQEMVKADGGIGIGFDGDGDRIGVVREDGEIVWGDHLLAIYSRPILKKYPGGKIIFEVKCSRGLIEYIESLGGVPIMFKTGHSLIKAKMREEGALLAGEMSGHMFFADNYYGYDDAIFAALRLLEIISQENRPLQAIDNEIPTYYSTPEIRVDCPDEKKFEIVDRIRREFEKRYRVITIDGVRVEYPDGWGLIRPSNTQPVLVLRFEARTEERLREIKSEFLNYLRRFLS
ncbi:phosphomannomutase [candidate division WOR-3 bacterium]|uniref:Phosphomannomutase n=1 Tax=candidate division WOR-3 bacterium TaxID=2052148 RepID=A0A660SL30_UNCW3|nr:MAG: phosphomannomutase [candidate division WOR-3 bacterium]